MTTIPKIYLDLVPEEVKDIDEALRVAKVVNRMHLDDKFGAAYVQSVFDRCEGTEMSPQIAIARERNAEQIMYDIHAECVFVTASLIAPNFLMSLEMDGDATGVISANKILEVDESNSYVFFHSVVPRPGWGEFVADLEYNHYKPGTVKNDLFKTFWTCIPPRSAQPVWVNVIGIPKSDIHLAEAAAATAGLRFSANGVVATVLTSEGISQCPLSGKNIYAMANIKGHAVYDNNNNFKELCEQDAAAGRAIAKENGFGRTGKDTRQV